MKTYTTIKMVMRGDFRWTGNAFSAERLDSTQKIYFLKAGDPFGFTILL